MYIKMAIATPWVTYTYICVCVLNIYLLILDMYIKMAIATRWVISVSIMSPYQNGTNYRASLVLIMELGEK